MQNKERRVWYDYLSLSECSTSSLFEYSSASSLSEYSFAFSLSEYFSAPFSP